MIRYKPHYTIAFILIMILGLSVPSVAQTGGEVWITNGFGNFFIAVIAGVLLAFAFQFLLTNLAVAMGITAMGDVRDKGKSSHSSSSESGSKDSSDSTSRGVKISSGFGLYLTITMAISLFFASLIAVKLSMIPSDTIGFTLGLVIWAGYLLLALFIDSKMISSLTGSIFSSVKDVLGAGSSAVGSVFSSGQKTQVKESARETVKAIHDEIRQEYDLTKIEKKLDEYVNKLEPDVNMDNVQEHLAELIHEIEVKEEYAPEDPETIKNLFLDVTSEQSNISEKNKKKLEEAFDKAKEIKKSGGSKADKAMSAADKLAPGGEEQGKKYRKKVEQYLRGTNEEELQPDKLKKDLDKILNDPKAAPDVVQARASKIDRSTLKSLLGNMKGMNEQKAEKYLNKAEEALNGIKSKASEAKNSSSSQASGKKEKAKQAIKQWLNRMHEPELRYEGLKHDAKRIMNDPKTAPSVLKKRLQRMDRESMIKLVSNNKKISREQAERIVDKFEQGRDEVLKKTEEIESKVKERTEQAKQEALKQAESARKTAAAAAWWIFLAAVVSGGASALGGIIALSL